MSNIDHAHPKFVSLINIEILGRAFLVALCLGSVLTLTNQPGAIFGTDTVQVLPRHCDVARDSAESIASGFGDRNR